MSHKALTKSQALYHSLTMVITGVSFGIVFFTMVNGAPLTGYLRALGTSDLLYGVIMALPLLGNIAQLPTAYFMETHGHLKTIFMISGFFRLLWIPITLVPFLIPAINQQQRLATATILIAIWAITNAQVGVTFNSWMGTLVPDGVRGRFFTKRYMIYTIIGALSGLATGKFLDLAPGFTGFAILFGVGAIFGVADIASFIGIEAPPNPVQVRPSFKQLFRLPFADRRYMRFIDFVGVWNFGFNFAAPFFNVYMLESLKMNYFRIFFLSQIISNLATICFIQVWGRIADRYGNKPVVAICCAINITTPFIWCFVTPGNYGLFIPLIYFLIGISQPGLEVTLNNLSIWLAPEQNRSVFIATYALITSLAGSMLAYICGGAFMQVTRPLLAARSIPFLLGQSFSGFHCLFIVSALLRIVAACCFLPRFSEDHSHGVRRIYDDLQNALRGRFTNRLSGFR